MGGHVTLRAAEMSSNRPEISATQPPQVVLIVHLVATPGEASRQAGLAGRGTASRASYLHRSPVHNYRWFSYSGGVSLRQEDSKGGSIPEVLLASRKLCADARSDVRPSAVGFQKSFRVSLYPFWLDPYDA
jgi:hypothetical protein